MVLYTVRLTGPAASGRRVTLVYSTSGGEEMSTGDADQGDAGKTEKGKTDHTGVITVWGPWSGWVRVFVDGTQAAEIAEWIERPADRYAELEAPPRTALNPPPENSV